MQEVVLITALFYAFFNGFHDAPSLLAQVVSTRSMEPRKALAWIGVLEFVGACFFSGAVLKTMSFPGLFQALEVSSRDKMVIFALASLLTALCFSFFTWYLGLPSSSSQAIFGAMVGVALSLGIGWEVVFFHIGKLILVLMASAVGAFCLGWIVTWIFQSIDISYTSGSFIFPAFNVASSGVLAMLHGANDAPKSLGLYFLSTSGMGMLAPKESAVYIVLFALAISVGMLFGENRILKTLGLKLFKVRILQGAGANLASSIILGSCTVLGFPASFTQVMVGAISGSGAAKNFYSVRWEVAGEILVSWVITFPACAAGGYILAGLLG